MDSLGPIENVSVREDPILNDRNKKMHPWSDTDSSSYSNLDHLAGGWGVFNFSSDETFLVRDSNRDSYSIYFDIETQIFEIDNEHSFISELENSFYTYRILSYLNNRSDSEDPRYDTLVYNTKHSWNNHINSCIDTYFR
ncbi:acetyl-CoA carboxylase carboxyltransferase beta subunit protein (chloroplast) [Tripterygium wilfordii]|uniref:Acetyl-CoA carboxylase carboxyltransferase beta subunit protein (Chloroplast) n=1 Tax=Tripterygium wilfordii TaxID=458696 RepID=A0A7J7CI22_TRIWF|nr:acetyl-CoA carboxylase carboxyltransferase beta subunit protein (chloroplast) [Tripterygium wilfordii]